MTGFINNIIERHLQSNNAIMPRLPGMFEQFDEHGQGFSDTTRSGVPGLDSIEGAEVNSTAPFYSAGTKLHKDLSSSGNESRNNAGTISVVSHKMPFAQPHEGKADTGRPTVANSVEPAGLQAELTARTFQKPQQNIPESLHKDNSPTHYSNDHSTSSIAPQMSLFSNVRHALDRPNDNTFQNSKPHRRYSLPNKNIQPSAGAIIETDKAPSIKVSIGRIEVRAIVASSSQKKSANIVQTPSMSLESYLKKRNGEK